MRKPNKNLERFFVDDILDAYEYYIKEAKAHPTEDKLRSSTQTAKTIPRYIVFQYDFSVESIKATHEDPSNLRSAMVRAEGMILRYINLRNLGRL